MIPEGEFDLSCREVTKFVRGPRRYVDYDCSYMNLFCAALLLFEHFDRGGAAWLVFLDSW